jgi:hypothetical protein
MRYREIQKALLANNCRWSDGKGSHIKWYCPCGKHMVPIQQHTHVSPGVVGDVIKKLSCLPQGWLQ